MRRLCMIGVCAVIPLSPLAVPAATQVRYQLHHGSTARYDLNVFTVATDSTGRKGTSLTAVVDQHTTDNNSAPYDRTVVTEIISGTRDTRIQGIGSQSVSLEAGEILQEALDDRGRADVNPTPKGEFEDKVLDAGFPVESSQVKPFLLGLGLVELPSGTLAVNGTETVTKDLPGFQLQGGGTPTVQLRWKLLGESVSHKGHTVAKYELTAVSGTHNNLTAEIDGYTITDLDITQFNVVGTLYFDNASGRVVEWNAVVETGGSIATTVTIGSTPTNTTDSFSSKTTVGLVLTSVAP